MTPQEIKELRISLGLTQEGLARLLGVGFQTINKWENGRTKPSPLAIKSIEALKKERGSV